jgi:hypothetical protein
MTSPKLILLGAALLAVALLPSSAQAQPAKLDVGMYAPSVAFADSTARANYVQGLAKAIQAKTGIPTTGRAYAKLADLRAAKPDFAIIEGLCLATGAPGQILATAAIGGATSQGWALFTTGASFGQLKGKKLAYLDTGCKDLDFMDNALLESEAKVKVYFSGGMVGRPETGLAVAAVREYKQAEAVFAPVTQGKGMTKAFEAGSVPNPGFVQLNKGLPAKTVTDVKDAVIAYGANLGIDGWRAAVSYTGLAGQMGARVKKPVFARPEPVALQDTDILVPPTSKFEQTRVRHHAFMQQ